MAIGNCGDDGSGRTSERAFAAGKWKAPIYGARFASTGAGCAPHRAAAGEFVSVASSAGARDRIRTQQDFARFARWDSADLAEHPNTTGCVAPQSDASARAGGSVVGHASVDCPERGRRVARNGHGSEATAGSERRFVGLDARLSGTLPERI